MLITLSRVGDFFIKVLAKVSVLVKLDKCCRLSSKALWWVAQSVVTCLNGLR